MLKSKQHILIAFCCVGVLSPVGKAIREKNTCISKRPLKVQYWITILDNYIHSTPYCSLLSSYKFSPGWNEIQVCWLSSPNGLKTRNKLIHQHSARPVVRTRWSQLAKTSQGANLKGSGCCATRDYWCDVCVYTYKVRVPNKDTHLTIIMLRKR